METARGVIDGIEAEGVPSGVAVTRRMTPYMDFEGLAQYIRVRAERARTAIAIHLDHATDVNLVRRALDAGFTSVQYDAPGLSMPEKLATTRQVVEIARRYGASTEAELDHIGREGAEHGEGLTDPTAAAEFVSESGIDILAVSVGTTHGLAAGRAELELELIVALRAAIPAFLALHGGTGVAPRDLVAAVNAGISKVSYFHGMADDALDALKAGVETTPHGMLATLLDEALRPAFENRCRSVLRILGGPGRPSAWLPADGG
jgi:fructose-bisphosphate aldolase class II